MDWFGRRVAPESVRTRLERSDDDLDDFALALRETELVFVTWPQLPYALDEMVQGPAPEPAIAGRDASHRVDDPLRRCVLRQDLVDAEVLRRNDVDRVGRSRQQARPR